MTKDELKIGLEELADRFSEGWHEGIKIDASDIMLLSKAAEALAQSEQEPVAWMWDVNNGAGYSSRGVGLHKTDIPFAKHTPLYTTPPQRKPLTPQSPCEMTQAEGKMFKLGWLECEAAHGIKE